MKKTWIFVAMLLGLAGASGCTARDEAQATEFGQGQANAAWPQQRMGASDAGAGQMLAALPVGTQQSAPPQLDTHRLVNAEIMDQAGFGRPVTAWRLQIPAGWQATGGVVWNDAANCHANMAQTAWSAIGPDSLSVIEIMPNFGWQVAGTEFHTDPCPVAPFRSARDFLQAAVQQSRPGARVLDYIDRPEWAQAAERQAEEMMRRMGGAPASAQTRRFDAGSVLLAFQQDGIEMREMLSTVVSFASMQGNVSGLASGVMSYRAPNNRLDLGLIERIAATMQQDSQWQAMAMPRFKQNIDRYFGGERRKIDEWHSRQMAIINARGMADRHAIRMRTNREVAGIYNSIAANTSATNDRMHRRGLEATGEYDTYAGNDGGTVHSSIHGGSRVFQDNSDPSRAWSTDDPYYSPSNATELERIP